MAGTTRKPTDTLSALFDVFVLSQAVADLLADGLAGAPLRAEEYAVYSAVLERPGATPTELARMLGAPLATVSDWLRTMAGRGHIVRSVRREDRRSYTVRLSATGRRAHRATNRRFEAVNARFVAALPGPEQDLRDVLGAAARAARAARAESLAAPATR